MVQIYMSITQCMDKFTCLKPCMLCHHHQEERIRGNVKGNSQEDIGTSLVELTGKFPIGNVKLEEDVAWRKCHIVQLTYVPGTNYMPPGIGVLLNRIQHLAYLVDMCPIRCRPASPLVPIYMAQLSIFIGPFIPDLYPMVVEVSCIGIAIEKPEQLMNDGFQVKFFGGHQWETILQVKAHLVTKSTYGTGPCTVLLAGSVLQHMCK